MVDAAILTPSQLAARWGYDTGTLENWRHAGKGPRHIKFGKGRACKVVYRLSDVRAYEQRMLKETERGERC